MENLFNDLNSTLEENISLEKINIYKNTSIPRDKKGCYQFLHVLEPLGIEFVKTTTVTITVTGDNIVGFATLYIHNVDDVKKIQVIRVGTARKVKISVLGELFLDINEVVYKPNNDVKFNFTVNLEMSSDSYIMNPILDIRTNKISDKVIEDERLFKNKVKSFENNEHGMLMISENIRVYMPKSKYIPDYFSPVKLLEFYEKIIASCNYLAGFNSKSSKKILQPRKQFVLISARTNHTSYASAGSTMMDTNPTTSKFYFNYGWGVLHEFGHLFEGNWSIAEIWTNMYSKYMAERTSEGFTWLWYDGVWQIIDRERFEKGYIENLYKKYLMDKKVSNTKLTSKIGLYFFISLEELLGADFTTKTETYARENSHLNSKLEYILYSIAKNYKINVIPYAELYEQQIDNQNLIDDIIDDSNSSPIYVPKNKLFNPYRYVSTPVTIKRIYVKNKMINGISNINSTIKVEVKNNIYTTETDNNGKFTFSIPIDLDLNDDINITSTEIGKSESMSKTFYLSNGLSDNTLTIMGLNKVVVAKINFNIRTKKFLITSTGKTPNSAVKNKEYFVMVLTNSNGEIKFRAAIKSDQSADNLKNSVEPLSFEYNDILDLISPVTTISITNCKGKKLYYNVSRRESFKITEDGFVKLK